MAPEVQDTFKEIKVKSNQLVTRVREVIREGEAKRIIIKREDHVYMEIPLSYGIGGAMAAIWLAPTLAAVGALAALVSEVELVIEQPGPVSTERAIVPAQTKTEPEAKPEAEAPVGDATAPADEERPES